LPAIEIGYSTERLPKSALRDPKKSDSKQSWKSLFICCARFLAARHLQQERGVAILLMDIDVIFAGRLEGIFAGAHYGLMPRLAQKNWCKRTLGGAVFVSSSPLGRAFLGHACRHIRKFLTLRLYWFAFDQYALYRALLHMKRHDGLANFRALTSAHVCFDLSAKAPILYPKGRSKGSKEFELLAKSATLPEPVRETANISEAVLPQIQLAANENLSESFEICAG